MDAAALRLTDAFGLLHVLHRRWAPHVLYLLAQRPARFIELQQAIGGISAASLNDRLKDLVAQGLVERLVDAGPPMSSLYRLIGRGAAVGLHLSSLARDTVLEDVGAADG